MGSDRKSTCRIGQLTTFDQALLSSDTQTAVATSTKLFRRDEAMPNMKITAAVALCLAGAVSAVPVEQLQPRQGSASATGVAQTGQAQTVTGFVPTSLPSLAYYALPGPDTAPK